MKNKIIFTSILTVIFITLISSICFAKYKLDQELGMQIYIDKTPPTITIQSADKNGTYPHTDLTNVIKNNCEMKISTADNIKIKQNEYVYNPNTKDFNNITPKTFDSGKILTDDGYYKITAIDTSGNKTEIIVLIDKTPPDVKVQFFKKGTVSSAKTVQVAGIKKNLSSAKTVNVVGGKTRNLLAAGNGASIDVYNESDLRNAISNKYSSIRIRNSIDCSNALTINYDVKIYPSSEDNAIRYSGYNSFITVQSGGTLTLDSIVIDTRGYSSNRGVIDINIASGGVAVLKTNSILDAGAGNYGMVINSGGTAQIHSCHIVYGAKGIIVKGNGALTFLNTEGGRCSEFWNNTTAISYEGFSGTSNINQSNIKIRDNTNGIVVESNSGTINMSNGAIYNNSGNGIVSKNGTFNVSGGSIYSCGNGINFGAGNLNISGGTIKSNTNGIYLNPNYTGKMTISNVNINSNSQYAIYHDQNGDGTCTITGGTITGYIYLAKNDNYVNTNSSYPTFTVKPSAYYFKRKLVKTTNNTTANNEIGKVTMVPSGDWYKYVDSEYIVIWRGCNILVKYVDYFGNLLSSETKIGNLGESYTTTAKTISGYDLIATPTNASGTYTEQDITIVYKYDIVNVAKVTFEDLLSGVTSAKYWYNANANTFSGNGTDFSNGTIFENYGYYKVVVTNSVGLSKELTFTLNKNSVIR